ncbi:hypothetical protein GMJAKD_14425 [Candidatus Electrothrix aarhusensis]
MQLVLQAKMVPRALMVRLGIKDHKESLDRPETKALPAIRDYKESLDRLETKVLLAIRE